MPADGEECGRLTAFAEAGLSGCWSPDAHDEIEDAFADIINKLCGNLGCGLSWDANGLQIKLTGNWGTVPLDFPGGVETGDVVFCDPDAGLRTTPRATSNFASFSDAMTLVGSFTGTAAEVEIPTSLRTAMLVMVNPSLARPMNVFIGLGARIGIAPTRPPTASAYGYAGLQRRINGGAWIPAQLAYSNQAILPGTHEDGTHFLGTNFATLQIAPGGVLTVDIRGVYYGTNTHVFGYDFALPAVVALGVTA